MDVLLLPAAAKVISSLLSNGAEATASGVAEQGGARLYDAVLQRVKSRLGGKVADQVAVENVLRDSMREGETTVEELQVIASIQVTVIQGQNAVGTANAKNLFQGGTQTIYEGGSH